MLCLSPEEYFGNIEYKLYFNISNKHRIEKYITQLNFRINEGHGKAIYIIGVTDNGYIGNIDIDLLDINILFLNYICKKLNCRLNFILKCNYQNNKFIICHVIKDNFIPKVIV